MYKVRGRYSPTPDHPNNNLVGFRVFYPPAPYQGGERGVMSHSLILVLRLRGLISKFEYNPLYFIFFDLGYYRPMLRFSRQARQKHRLELILSAGAANTQGKGHRSNPRTLGFGNHHFGCLDHFWS